MQGVIQLKSDFIERRMKVNYKYDFENLEDVEVKQSFTVHKTDDEGDVEETIDIPIGVTANVLSMGSSSVDNFAVTYEFEMEVDGREITVTVLEENVEQYFAIR